MVKSPNKNLKGVNMDIDVEDDNDLDGVVGSMVYEMLATIEDEFRDGSCQRLRDDTFAIAIEGIFGIPVDELDDLEEKINGDDKKIEFYDTIKSGIRNLFDKYYGITFEDKVDLNKLHDVYHTVYVDFFDLLTTYGIGTEIYNNRENDVTVNDFVNTAKAQAKKHNTYLSVVIIGNKLADENSFTLDQVTEALFTVDPGNAVHEYIFGQLAASDESLDSHDNLIASPEVFIDVEAFRRRLLSEFNYNGTDNNYRQFDALIVEYTDRII